MFRSFFSYFVCLILVFFTVSMIAYGSLLRYHYLGGKKYTTLQSVAVFFAEIPYNISYMFKNKTLISDTIEPLNDVIYSDTKKFEKFFNPEKIDQLILLSRFDNEIKKTVVEIRDINNFGLIHRYIPNIEKLYKKLNSKKEHVKFLKEEQSVTRFPIIHPEITSKAELIFSGNSPLVKMDLKGNFIWINDDFLYHHSINMDEEENIYLASHNYNYSNKLQKYLGKSRKKSFKNRKYYDDAISIIDKDGKLIFSKSVTEILIDNGFVGRVFSQDQFYFDPIHLNDVQPVVKNTKFFKKGDLFLSLRNLSMVLLYRPSTNKIIKKLEGKFFNQHDVDILKNERISIYNNNVFLNHESKRSAKTNEIIVYDFNTDKYSKLFSKTFKENEINTVSEGLADFLDDESVIIEDTNNGRIFYLDNQGKVIWKFNNISSNKKKYPLFWLRVIDREKSNKIKKIFLNLK